MKKKQNIYNKNENFTLLDCEIELSFKFENIEDLFQKDETNPDSQRIKEKFFEFIIYTEPVEGWQITTLSASESSPTFNFFSNHFLKVIIF
jgi:hypothetical protein